MEALLKIRAGAIRCMTVNLLARADIFIGFEVSAVAQDRISLVMPKRFQGRWCGVAGRRHARRGGRQK
jgi:hypothetical protein